MKITWLGQAGLLMETRGKTVVIDPYLSDSVAKVQPQNYRRVPVDTRFLEIKPDVIVLTHDHLDHTDKETLARYLTGETATVVLASGNAWKNVRSFGGKHNYVLFNNGTEWTEAHIRFRAVYAEHSDEKAIGVIVSAEDKNYYITGDTLYNENVFESLPKLPIEAVFLPVNGKGNNMNFTDAKRFAERVGAKYTVPVHFGLFDDLSVERWDCEKAVVPKIYEEIAL